MEGFTQMPRPTHVPYSNSKFNNPVTRGNLKRAQNESIDFFLNQSRNSTDKLVNQNNQVQHTFVGVSEHPSFIVKKSKQNYKLHKEKLANLRHELKQMNCNRQSWINNNVNKKYADLIRRLGPDSIRTRNSGAAFIGNTTGYN